MESFFHAHGKRLLRYGISRVLRILSHFQKIQNLLIQLNEDHLASMSSLVIVIWNLMRRENIYKLEAHNLAGASLILLYNGMLASCCLGSTIKIWKP